MRLMKYNPLDLMRKEISGIEKVLQLVLKVL